MKASLKKLSRKLRGDQTDAEKKLWRHLRKEQLNGIKFRRQVPIDDFIADFVSFEKRLIIELDGGQHAEILEYDEKRTKILESNGFLVLRFWNNEVLKNIEGVLITILDTVNPPPTPSLREGN